MKICGMSVKSRGFDLESTHITEPERLTKMIFLLTLVVLPTQQIIPQFLK